MDIDQLFKGMKEAPMFGRGNYMNDEGVYLVELTNVFVKPRWKGGNIFVAEFKILESNNDAHKAGSSRSWAPKLELPNTFGDIKALVLAAIGTDPKSVTEADKALHEQATLLARAVCGSESAKAELKTAGIDDFSLVGCRVRLETMPTKTKENKPFTRYTWSPA